MWGPTRKLPTGRAEEPIRTHKHVGNAGGLLRCCGRPARSSFNHWKEYAIEASEVVLLGAGWRTR